MTLSFVIPSYTAHLAYLQDELEKKYVGLVQSYGADLKTVQELFLQNRDSPPISWNLPPIAGALTWCRGLVDRIQIPMAKLQQLDRTILDREEAKEVAKVSDAEHFNEIMGRELMGIPLSHPKTFATSRFKSATQTNSSLFGPNRWTNPVVNLNRCMQQ